jgi:hypothetical protein
MTRPTHGGRRAGAGRPARGIVRVCPRAGLDATEARALEALMALWECDAVTAVRMALVVASASVRR